MRWKRRCWSVLLLGALPLAAVAAATTGVWDAPSRLFPGQYFEQKAQFYLKKRDYRAALQMFELSGFWADKVSQYNVGIMYFSGIGVPADRVKGAAWLGIAAEAHDDLADQALQVAYASLSADEKRAADAEFRALDRTYGDAVSVPRALAQYAKDSGASIFRIGDGGFGTSQTCFGPAGCVEENGSDFEQRMLAERNALVRHITGHVSVGQVAPLAVDAAAKPAAAPEIPLAAPATPAVEPPAQH